MASATGSTPTEAGEPTLPDADGDAPSPYRTRLRRKLVVRIVALVAALAIGLGVTTQVLVGDALRDERVRSAREQFDANRGLLATALGDDGFDALALLASLRPDVRARELLYADGRWSATSDRFGPEDLPAGLVAAVDAGDPVEATVDTPGGRVLVLGAPLPDGDRYFEVFGLDDLESTLSTLRRALLGAGLLAVAAGAAVAWLLARQVTRPMALVSDAATRIASGDLDVRIERSADEDLDRIARSFNRMAASLQERIAAESRFAADVSHELRSPLTTLLNAATVLERRRHELSAEGQEALDLLVEDMARFEHLVADLVEITKHDAGTVRPDFDYDRIGSVVLDALRRLQADDTVPMTVSDEAVEAVARVDRRRFERVLQNVLANARAYGGGATAVVVDARDGEALVHVDDEGPGVPREERERIFERFARGVHGERRSTADGSGLGLALARENMRAMGGDIAVVANPTRTGARFTLRLPRVDTSALEPLDLDGR